jgi:hypothetical protein
MQRAKVLYLAILEAKPGNDLAFAIRDRVQFERLKEESIAQVAMAVVLFAKGVAKLEEEGQKATEQAKETPAETAATAPETPATTPTAPKKK